MQKNINNSFLDTFLYLKELEAYNNIGKNGCVAYSEWQTKVWNRLPNTVMELKEVKYFFVRKKRAFL